MIATFCRCDRCDTARRSASTDGLPLHWMRLVNHRGQQDLCPDCVRAQRREEERHRAMVSVPDRPYRKRGVLA